MHSGVFTRIIIGLMVVGAGVLFLLSQLGVVWFGIGDLIRTFWPMILIVIGIGGLLDRKSTWEYAIPLVIGLYFLGNNLGVVDFSFGDLIRYAIPFIIIGVGLSMIFKRKEKRETHREEEWQAYPNDSSPIPPAPPLHPDPTKSDGTYDPARDYDERYRADAPYGQAGYEANGQPHYGPQGPQGQHGSRDHHGSHGHKDAYGPHGPHGAYGTQSQGQDYGDPQYKHSHTGRERVEWWNNDPNVQTRSNFIGDIHLGQDYWELKPMNISHFIGDTTLDLTKAQIPYGETKLTISTFIGDVKVFLPSDVEVGIDVVSSAFIGDAKILDRKDSGFFLNTRVESRAYDECDKKVRLVVSTFIGDVKVTKVG